jgi:hypothetical protein
VSWSAVPEGIIDRIDDCGEQMPSSGRTCIPVPGRAVLAVPMGESHLNCTHDMACDFVLGGPNAHDVIPGNKAACCIPGRYRVNHRGTMAKDRQEHRSRVVGEK